MSGMNRFEDLNCWKNARIFVKKAYSKSKNFDRDWGAQRQFQRAAVSVMNNIAEGFGRFSKKEFIRFLEISQSSAMECKSMLYVFEDLNYLNKEELSELHSLIDLTRNQIMGFIKYLRKSQQ